MSRAKCLLEPQLQQQQIEEDPYCGIKTRKVETKGTQLYFSFATKSFAYLCFELNEQYTKHF